MSAASEILKSDLFKPDEYKVITEKVLGNRWSAYLAEEPSYMVHGESESEVYSLAEQMIAQGLLLLKRKIKAFPPPNSKVSAYIESQSNELPIKLPEECRALDDAVVQKGIRWARSELEATKPNVVVALNRGGALLAEGLRCSTDILQGTVTIQATSDSHGDVHISDTVIEGKVVVIDDVARSGNSMRDVVSTLRELGVKKEEIGLVTLMATPQALSINENVGFKCFLTSDNSRMKIGWRFRPCNHVGVGNEPCASAVPAQPDGFHADLNDEDPPLVEGLQDYGEKEKELEALIYQSGVPDDEVVRVSTRTRGAVLRILRSLPHEIPSPDLDVLPTGHVVLEWTEGVHSMFSMAISADENLIRWAGTYAPGKRRKGTEPFTDDDVGIPEDMLLEIRRLHF